MTIFIRWIYVKKGCKLRAREADDIFFPFTTLGALCFRTVFAGLKGRNTLYTRGKRRAHQYRANIGSQKVKGSWRLASTFWLTLPGGSCLRRPYCQSLQSLRARSAKKSASLARGIDSPHVRVCVYYACTVCSTRASGLSIRAILTRCIVFGELHSVDTAAWLSPPVP